MPFRGAQERPIPGHRMIYTRDLYDLANRTGIDPLARSSLGELALLVYGQYWGLKSYMAADGATGRDLKQCVHTFE